MSSGGAAGRTADVALRVLLPAVAALTLVGVVAGRAREVDSELHLIAPAAVSPGASLPLRAHVYAGLRDPQGPRLVRAAIDVELRGADRVLARTTLAPSFASTFDGALSVPAEAHAGQITLVARAAWGGAPVVVERVVAIVPRVAPDAPGPRASHALRALALGPTRAEPSAVAPDGLEVRVRGGACAPEVPCEILVRVGEPASAVAVASTASVTPARESERPGAETTGVVALVVTTHGPEAELHLHAHRDGALVARRAVRLPVALGLTPLFAIEVALVAPARPRVLLVGEAGGCIVDAFRDGQWLRTSAIDDCARGGVAPFAALDPGAWRIQARRDAFGSDTAAVRAVFVRRPDQTDTEVLTELSREVVHAAPEDALARMVARDPAAHAAAFAPTAGWLLASLEDGVFAQPAARSSLPAALAELERERGRIHAYALAALAATALALAFLVARRGLHGGAEADRILTEAGSLRPPRRTWLFLRVAIVVATLLFLFAAIGIYLVLRIRGP